MYYMCVLFVRAERLPILEQYETIWRDYQSTYVLYMWLFVRAERLPILEQYETIWRDYQSTYVLYVCVVCEG